MSSFVIAGSLTFCLACLAVGLRLLLLFRRTRKLPELLMGAALFSGGFLGYLAGLVVEWVDLPQFFDLGLRVVGRILVGGSSVAVLVAAWRIFRPDRAWAGVFVGVLATLHLPYLLRDIWFAGREPGDLLREPLYWGWTLARVACYAWMSWESFQAQARMRRRWHVGLPVAQTLISRMLFWTLGSGSIAAMFVTISTFHVLEGTTDLTVSSRQVIAVLGLVCSVCLWFAFFPPQAYLRRISAKPAPEAA